MIDGRLDVAALVSDFATELATALVDGARPAVRFATRPLPEDRPVPVGVSRFGGLPDLPPGFEWPMWIDPRGDGVPHALSFFAQVDLASVAGATDLPLPSAGLLAFFCDFLFDDDGGITGLYQHEHEGCRVVHVPPGHLVPTTPPHDIPSFKPALLLPISVTTLPEPDDCADEDYNRLSRLDDRYENHMRRQLPDGWAIGGRHQLGGHARTIQRPVEEEVLAAAENIYRPEGGFDHARWEQVSHQVRDWRLLLQIDSDDDLGVMWGDVGTLYWATRLDSLAARDWHDVWFDFQCC